MDRGAWRPMQLQSVGYNFTHTHTHIIQHSQWLSSVSNAMSEVNSCSKLLLCVIAKFIAITQKHRICLFINFKNKRN